MDYSAKALNSLAEMPFLHRFLVLISAATLFAGCQNKYSKMKLRPASAVTSTSQQKALLRSLARNPKPQLGLLLDAANVARLQIAARPTDALARSNYNFAVSRIVDLIEEHSLEPWVAPIAPPAPEGGAGH